MATNDGGTIALLEQAIADKLATLKYNDKSFFKKTEPWRYQIWVDKGGAIQGFMENAPFGFTKFVPGGGSNVEGGDTCRHFKFEIFFGQQSKERGVARIGDANNIGISKMYDIIFAAFNGWQPDASFNIGTFYYDDDAEMVDEPNNYGMSLFFRADKF